MIAMTTRSSMSVNPRRILRDMVRLQRTKNWECRFAISFSKRIPRSGASLRNRSRWHGPSIAMVVIHGLQSGPRGGLAINQLPSNCRAILRHGDQMRRRRAGSRPRRVRRSMRRGLSRRGIKGAACPRVHPADRAGEHDARLTRVTSWAWRPSARRKGRTPSSSHPAVPGSWPWLLPG